MQAAVKEDYVSVEDYLAAEELSDIRVNLSLHDDEYYYYPDLVVTCDAKDDHPRFVRYPKLIVEVSSPGTPRVDRREKFFAYTSMESLEEYVLVAQDAPEVTLFRRANRWRPEKIEGAAASVTLSSLDLELPFETIYEGV